ncbi:hypothetical protein D3C73_1114690 [compost metagenome]
MKPVNCTSDIILIASNSIWIIWLTLQPKRHNFLIGPLQQLRALKSHACIQQGNRSIVALLSVGNVVSRPIAVCNNIVDNGISGVSGKPNSQLCNFLIYMTKQCRELRPPIDRATIGKLFEQHEPTQYRLAVTFNLKSPKDRPNVILSKI